MSGNITILVRVRPLNKTDSKLCILTTDGTNIELEIPNEQSKRNTEKTFRFRKVYDEVTLTKTIFDDYCFDIIDSVFKGFNGTIISYGATGSGKTYTMYEDPNGGIIQQAFQSIYKIQETSSVNYTISMSYFEIYKNDITDLLNKKDRKQRLDVMDNKKNPYVSGLIEEPCKSVEDCLRIFEKGCKARKTATTKKNPNSSRSHALIKISIQSAAKNSANLRGGVLYLVDLAGSERIKESGAEGINMREARDINLSMLALGNVITALAAKKKPPYRDTKLTHILQNALGGNSKTAFITNVSPASNSYEATLNSLRYANRAQLINNTIFINEDSKDRIIRELMSENDQLKKQIEELNKTKITNDSDYNDENSDKDDEDDIDESKLLPFEKEKLEKKRQIKTKIRLLQQNKRQLKEINKLFEQPLIEKDVDEALQQEINQKRHKARQMLLDYFKSDQDYTEEDNEILKMDINRLEKVNINKIYALLHKQNGAIEYQKQYIHDSLEFAQADRDLMRLEITTSELSEPDSKTGNKNICLLL